MRVLFAGTPEVAVPTLAALMDHPDHEVVGVLTRADARKGRGRTLHPSAVAVLARQAGLDVRTPATLREENIASWVRSLDADVAVVVAYGRLVPANLLNIPTHGWLNLHFSLLPAWRGAAPVQRALMAGEALTGASIFRLEEGLDTGPVYASLTEPIRATDTAGDLLERLADAGAPLVLDVLSALAEGTAQAQPQPAHGVTLAPQLTTSEGQVDWTQASEAIDCHVRGVTPAPGAWTTFRGARLRLGPVELVDEGNDATSDGAGRTGVVLAPGHLAVSKHEVLVGTGGGAVRLGQVAPAGKKWMTADAWARGAHPEVGEILGQDRATGEGSGR